MENTTARTHSASPYTHQDSKDIDLEKQILSGGRNSVASSAASSSDSTSYSAHVHQQSRLNPQPGPAASSSTRNEETLQRTTTSQSNVVPRSKRRGLLGQLTIVHE